MVEVGIFSDAALALFAATVFVNLGKAAVQIFGGDVTSDAVEPLKWGKQKLHDAAEDEARLATWAQREGRVPRLIEL